MSKADLEAAQRARHPSVLPKHWVMMAASGVIYEDGKLLLVRDRQGFWAGVGGWIDEGESPEEAIVREAREELGVEAEVVRHMRPFVAWHVAELEAPVSFVLFPHRLRLASLELRPDAEEITAVEWAAPEALGSYEMLPHVRSLYEERLEEWIRE